MENLPPELMYEILLRLPATILWNVARHVCQSWHSIISESTFVRAHGSRYTSDEEGKTLLFHRNLFNYKEGFFIYSSIGGVELIGQKLQLPIDIDGTNTITLVCNGLVLYIYYKNETVSLYLCNPILNQSTTLPPMSKAFGTFFYWTSGFGYDSTTEEYKVVHVFKNLGVSPKISHFYRCRINPSSKKRTNNYCWEEVGSTDHDVCDRNHLTVFVNGKIHWLLSPYTSSSEVKMLTFDLRTEFLTLLRFRLSPEPGYLVRSVLLKNYNTEKLSLEVTYQNSRTVWVMMEYGIENSLVEESCESNIQRMRAGYFYSGHWKKDLRLFEKIYDGPRGYVVVGKSRENIVNSIDFSERNMRNRFLSSFVPSLLSLRNEEEKR